MTHFSHRCRSFRQATDYVRILPELILSAFGIVVMVLDPLVDEEKSQKTLGLIAFVGTVAGFALDVVHGRLARSLAFSNTVRVDRFSIFFTFLVIAIASASSFSARSSTWRSSGFAPGNITHSSCSAWWAWS